MADPDDATDVVEVDDVDGAPVGDEDGDAASVEGAGAATRAVAPGRWAAVGGVLTLAYLLWYVGDLVLLDRQPRSYVIMHELYGTLFMRLVFATVFLGLVFHGLDGLRTTVRFLTFAVWVPGAFALVWPAIRSRFAR